MSNLPDDCTDKMIDEQFGLTTPILKKDRSKTMSAPKTFSLEIIEEAMENQSGFCIDCGAERDCCKPDARQYECDECGAMAVYGAEELIIMGHVE